MSVELVNVGGDQKWRDGAGNQLGELGRNDDDASVSRKLHDERADICSANSEHEPLATPLY